MGMSQLLVIGLIYVCFHQASAYFFNDYVYAQQWPAAFCFSHHSKNYDANCNLAKNISTWTNHGLWPSVNETYPNNCNDSWPLKESSISGLLDVMRSRWPSYDTGSTYFGFWEHEWVKHGTCASNVSMLYGPYKYFSFTLDLNAKYDLLSMLGSKGIKPRIGPCYNYTDFSDATKELFNETAILGCVWNKETKQQHIAQIEICFDKSFRLRCNPNLKHRAVNVRSPYTSTTMPEVEPCWHTEQICYFPIPH